MVDGAAPRRTFAFASDAPAGGAIRFDPTLNPATHSFTDWLVYDVTKNQGPRDRANTFDTPGLNPVDVLKPQNTVTDLKLSLFYQRTSGTGPLRLQLKKAADTFTAEATPGKVVLTRRTDGAGGADVALGEANVPALAGAEPVQLELMNVDHQVTLRVDGRVVLQTTPEQYRPDLKRLMSTYDDEVSLPPPEVRVSAAAQRCTLSHVGLWRDIYYTNRADGGSPLHSATPDRPVALGPDEFFVLGDNSPMSSDARYWTHPIRLPHEGIDFVEAGRVPGRFMLGKAFFVYWPAGYRPTPAAPGLVPNFGDMRFIH
jgi:type IV secretory pathway protease TraF